MQLVNSRLVLINKQIKNIEVIRDIEKVSNVTSYDLVELYHLAQEIAENKKDIDIVAQAILEAKPAPITDEQREVITLVRKLFTDSSHRYKLMLQAAQNIHIDKNLVDNLQKGQQLSAL